ncbi:MAG: class I SAM-dependent methyltransferase [Alphaproteobacteria bacterium]
MYNDVIDLRDFYNSPLGHTAQRIVRRYIRSAWPNTRGMSIAGIGYPTPYLRPFLDEAERVVALMPAQQGVMRWPTEGRNVVSLAQEDDLPLPDVSMDRILLVHALECSEQLRKLLREVWRVMTESGRVLIVVPNRRGIWARMDHTPFGHGHPYTPVQVSRLLRDNLFQPETSVAGLFVPPMRSRMALTSARPIERIGFRWFQTIGGVLFIEAQKQIYAGSASTEPAAEPARKRGYVRVVGGTERGSMSEKD